MTQSFPGRSKRFPACRRRIKRKPVDASCSGYSAADGYTLVPADYGTTIDETALKNAVAEAVEGLEDTLDLEKSGCYVDPAVGDDDKDLLAVIDELNQYVASTVTYDFGDQKEVVDGSTISEWLSVLDGELEVDEEAVLDYVKGLAKTYNTAYKPKTLKTSYGPEVTISNGAYGWKIDTEERWRSCLRTSSPARVWSESRSIPRRRTAMARMTTAIPTWRINDITAFVVYTRMKSGCGQ